MGLFKCLNFQSFPLYLSKRKASVHFHEQMPCLKAVFLQPHYPPHPIFRFLWHNAALADAEPLAQWFLGQGGFLCLVAFDGISKFKRGHT